MKKKRSKNIKKPVKKARTQKQPMIEVNKLPVVLVDIYFLAKYFKRVERTVQIWVRKWRSEGMINTNKRGLYDFIECLKWYQKDLESELLKKTSGDESETQIRKDMAAIKRDTAAHDLAVKRSQVIKIDDAKYILSNACVLANKGLMAIPSTHANKLLAYKTPEEVETHLKDAIGKELLNAADLANQADSFAKKYSDNVAQPELAAIEMK